MNMLIIIIKIILCSSLFIAIYYWFLEKERIYRFNRFYLLGSLALSYLIPFISISLQLPKEKISRPQLIIEDTAQKIIAIHNEPEGLHWMSVLWIIYASVTLLFLLRSIFAVLKIIRIKGNTIIYKGQRVLLTNENLSPFSFWNTIYLGRAYLKEDEIDPRIFLHEKSHISQKHSLDLILIDVLKIFTWFNPVLFLYKKTIVTNHEFLADEAVLKNQFSIREYQNLILDEIINTQSLPLTHTFNFNNTKKRFIMMTTKKTKFSLLKKTAGITSLIAAIAVFSEKTYANNSVSVFNNHNTSAISSQQINPVKTGTSHEISSESPARDEKSTVLKPATAEVLKKEEQKMVSDTITPKTAIKEEPKANATIDSGNGKDFVEAKYPGGNAELRKKIGNTMDMAVINPLKGTITSTAYIQIDETGKATQITTSGNDEVFNKEYLKTITAISNETTWQPATKNGKAIATSLKIPATMTFENFK
ncbi:M56 family metallopeptidase [Chryseobacterium gallinarum]|uniref:M56 family metallopeptidase n=1 Tax=Chryseobacterium gallinarum TaxID=1324352 RepID=UPI00202524E2|nr:M56 family metallopeptidase [Chryseobacterium gallinarum]MCL8536008.1 M56 family metallopeptidase [Chryseobacterium gallinarum]